MTSKRGDKPEPSREVWRLLRPTANDGPENMAMDEALIELVGADSVPPTLRFYLWRSPWISLGSGESAADLDRDAITERGWGIVRRASGGTAVLHLGQLGYCLGLPAKHCLWSGDLVASYERLGQPFRAAFGRLGVDVEPALPGANAEFIRGAPAPATRTCFGALGPYELTWRGRKVIGNAQVRRRQSAAQHGVIQVSESQRPLADVIAVDPPEDRCALANFLDRRVASLEQCIGRPILPDKVVEAIVTAVQEDFNVVLVDAEPSPEERETAAELARAKYRDPAWTFRR